MKKKRRKQAEKIDTPSLGLWITAGLLIAAFIIGLFFLKKESHKQSHQIAAIPRETVAAKPKNTPTFEFYAALPDENPPMAEAVPEAPSHEAKAQAEIPATAEKTSIPEKTIETKPVVKTPQILLQAASFPRYQEADSLKAKLLLAGFTSEIRTVKIADKTWYRVMVGPYEDPAKAKLAQQKLSRQQVSAIMVKIPAK